MNKERRQMLSEAIDTLEDVDAIINEVIDGEQEAFDNLPESFQCSERGENMESAISDLEELAGDIEDLKDRIQEVIDNY